MKKILLFLIITLSILGCTKDFVDRVPTNNLVIESFYKTPDDGTKALTSVYNMLLRDDYWSSYFRSEAASDDCAGGAGSGDGGGFQRWDRGLEEPAADATLWQTYYGGIFRACIYLDYESKINWTGKEALRIQYQAEAKFLRAYFHFYLTRLYGEIPSFDHAYDPTKTYPRTPADKLFGLIISDLKFAAENALSAKYAAMNPNNWGRATKWAAEAMIARVYLFYSGYYNQPTLTVDGSTFGASDAKGYIDDVINNSGHSLVPKFASLWIVPAESELGGDSTYTGVYAGEDNPEVVWSVIFNITGNEANSYGGAWWERLIGPRGTNIQPYGNGWGGIPVLPTLWKAYDTADSRRKATILSWDGEGLTYNYAAQQQAQYTGYNSKKYMKRAIGNAIDPIYPDWQWDGFEDYMVIRYADVLLMGAELCSITGSDLSNGITGLECLNEVRERAFGDATHDYAALTIDNVFAERRLELAMEGLRYFDILRSCKGDFSKLAGILTYVDPNDAANFTRDANSAETVYCNVDGNNFVATKGLFQIPQTELDLMNGVVQQNPGYTK